MKRLSKILVVIAVLCALGYTFHRFQSCQIVGASPGEAPSALAPKPAKAMLPVVTPSRADSVLVYPNHTALESLKLGYQILQVNSDGSVMALPLPPEMALQTTFMLSPAGHHSLSISGVDDKCAAGIEVNIYRLDQERPVYTGRIAPAPKRTPLLINFNESKLSDPFIVTLKLAQGAKNNWFCNVALSWDSVK